MKTLIAAGLLLALAGCQPAKVSWVCNGKGEGEARVMECVFTGEQGKGTATFDLVLTCGTTEHVAKVKSKALGKGETETVSVPITAFQPAVKADQTCGQTKFKNEKLE